MAFLLGKWEQALTLLWNLVYVFSARLFSGQTIRPRKGLEEKQRKRTK
jgi:hypothetical protein